MGTGEDPGEQTPRITYVHDGKEVMMTGRTAVRETSRRQHVLYEIKPIDVEGSDPKFCKWVKIEELYEIQ